MFLGGKHQPVNKIAKQLRLKSNCQTATTSLCTLSYRKKENGKDDFKRIVEVISCIEYVGGGAVGENGITRLKTASTECRPVYRL